MVRQVQIWSLERSLGAWNALELKYACLCCDRVERLVSIHSGLIVRQLVLYLLFNLQAGGSAPDHERSLVQLAHIKSVNQGLGLGQVEFFGFELPFTDGVSLIRQLCLGHVDILGGGTKEAAQIIYFIGFLARHHLQLDDKTCCQYQGNAVSKQTGEYTELCTHMVAISANDPATVT